MRCFVVMGYGIRPDLSSGKKINLDRIYYEIIKPAVIESGFECIRGDEVLDSGLIDESMYYGILESDLVVADLTTLNPNAIYELGVRHGVRKNRTIIMMETGDKFFFDLNHNRTLTYTYVRNRKKFTEEAERVKIRLKAVIDSIVKENQVDSPLYKFIPALREPVKDADEALQKKDSKPLFERIKEAIALRKKERYEEAKNLFTSLIDDVPFDPYFRQQKALCTYKSEKPSPKEALEEALNILSPLENTVDPETNGLLGAIFKRKFYLSNAESDIIKAINYYKKAYCIFSDYYNGENYAFCLLLRASLLQECEEKIELKVIAKHIYRDVFESNRNYIEDEVNTDYEIWTLATLASCSLVLNEKELSDKYEKSFLSRADKMMKTSYLSQKQKLVELLKS